LLRCAYGFNGRGAQAAAGYAQILAGVAPAHHFDPRYQAQNRGIYIFLRTSSLPVFALGIIPALIEITNDGPHYLNKFCWAFVFVLVIVAGFGAHHLPGDLFYFIYLFLYIVRNFKAYHKFSPFLCNRQTL